MSDSSTNKLRQTSLFSTHVALGGNMVDFGGWEMPLWYSTGAIKEHMAVIRAAGLFDTSHMSVVLAKGETARGFLNTPSPATSQGSALSAAGTAPS
jgi:Glycine cleavage system T protein (aminomethyltransferase)